MKTKQQQVMHSTRHTKRGYSAIGLVNPKTPANVGSSLRACGVYDAAMLAYTGRRYGKAGTDTIKQYRHMPLIRVDDLRDIVPHDCVPVAVELKADAKPLHTYCHPERAFYIFGPEDSSLGAAVTSWCRDIVYVPGNGCMNLAATVNVVLYDRMVKTNNVIDQELVA